VFMTALYVFHERRADEVGALHFTKDDPPAVALVAAAANLRSRCYGIPTQSQFAAAGMAGNIIHAIATTNAVVAGLITTEALKLLAGCRDACRNTWLTGVRPAACMLACCSRHNPRHSARPTGTPLQACTARAPRSPHCPTCMQALPNQYGKLSTVTVLPRPNSACMVCGHALMCVTAPLVEFTLARLVDVVLKRDMAFAAPTIVAESFLYEEGDDLEEEEVAENARMRALPLAALPGGVAHNSRLEVSELSQNLKVTLVLADAVRAVPHACVRGRRGHRCSASRHCRPLSVLRSLVLLRCNRCIRLAVVQHHADTHLLHVQTVDLEQHPDGYVLVGSLPVAQGDGQEHEAPHENRPTPAAEAAAAAPAPAPTSGDVIDLLADEEAAPVAVSSKRKVLDDAGPAPSNKARKNDVIELD
jgi:Ubiquitin/SUMO-activating enzyme ubiquitin-like domain/ThiF family/Ubiquitin-activating enzyme active site